MSVLSINNSIPKLEWSKLHNIAENKDRFTLTKGKDLSPFVPEFPSPADEVKKTLTTAEAQKSDKRSRPFSHTSENWIG